MALAKRYQENINRIEVKMAILISTKYNLRAKESKRDNI